MNTILVYCVYNYYHFHHAKDSVNLKELLEINKQFLSKEKQEQFYKMLKLYDREEKEGNGDIPEDIIYFAEKDFEDFIYQPLAENHQSLPVSSILAYVQNNDKNPWKLEALSAYKDYGHLMSDDGYCVDKPNHRFNCGAPPEGYQNVEEIGQSV